MNLFIISDLHLKVTDEPLYGSLLTILKERCNDGDIIVLAGDLFDVFIGTKHIFTDCFKEFIEAVRIATARGAKVHYIEGNHDFFMRNAFRDLKGFVAHARSFTVEIEGKRFFVAHGDTVDKSAYFYRGLRLLLRSSLMRMISAVTPGAFIRAIGEAASRRGRAKRPVVSDDLPPAVRENMRRMFRNFAVEKISSGYDFVALGHCHDPDEMIFKIGDRSGQYINVGYPRVHGTFLLWRVGDEKIRREPLP
ncbi:MAG: metallophosphoesterase [Candidatus Poribacteria bacterium]